MTSSATLDDGPLPQLPARPEDSHKGHFGTALLIGGAPGMAGAIALAGMAALRCGAGLVRVATPETSQQVVAGFSPCYMTLPLPTDRAGRLILGAGESVAAHLATATAIGLGPGLGRSPQSDTLVQQWYLGAPQAMVVDADALNSLSTSGCLEARAAGLRVLTPHPGEFLRLVGRRERLSPDERRPLAEALAAKCGAVVVLKGHRTIITDGQRTAINGTGNSGMATGGMGDVLTGVVAGLLAQGLAPFEAARLGAHVHGLAGDLAAAELGPVGIVASDVVDRLPRALEHSRSSSPG